MIGQRVSVVIPAYRAAGTLGRALASLAMQDRPADEVIVVDDGSPDGAELAGLVAEQGGNCRLIRQANGGASAARNTGINAATGDLIAFLDADDYWEADKLRRQLAVLAAHPEVGLVAGLFFSQEPGGERRVPVVSPSLALVLDCVLTPHGADAFDLATRVWTTTVLVRRSVLGAHRFVSGLEPAEDRDLWSRLVAVTPTYLTARPVATNVLEPNSLSRSSVDADCGNMLKVVRRHADLLGRRQVRNWEADTFRRWAAGHLSQGRPRAAIVPALRRLRRAPLSVQGWYILAKATALAAAAPRMTAGSPSRSI